MLVQVDPREWGYSYARASVKGCRLGAMKLKVFPIGDAKIRLNIVRGSFDGVFPLYDVGTPVYFRKKTSEAFAHAVVVESGALGAFANLTLDVYTEDGFQRVVGVGYLDYGLVEPQFEQALGAGGHVARALYGARAGMAAPFSFLQCSNSDYDLFSFQSWMTFAPSKLATLVYLFPSADATKPECFFHDDIVTLLQESQNALSPWVGYTDDNGRDGYPFASVQFRKLRMLSNLLLDSAASNALLAAPGCYELETVDSIGSVRVGLTNDFYGASTGIEGEIHGQADTSMRVSTLATQGASRCSLFLTASAFRNGPEAVQRFCTDAVNSTLQRTGRAGAHDGVELLGEEDAMAACGCQWQERSKIRLFKACSHLGSGCFRVPEETVRDHKVCCCPFDTSPRTQGCMR